MKYGISERLAKKDRIKKSEKHDAVSILSTLPFWGNGREIVITINVASIILIEILYSY